MERVRSDLEVVSRAGLGVTSFLAEVDASLRRAVPYAAMCVSLHDPATAMTTATFKFGEIADTDTDTHDRHWCEVVHVLVVAHARRRRSYRHPYQMRHGRDTRQGDRPCGRHRRADDTITQMNAAAEHWLGELARCDNSEGPIHTLAALVAGARRYSRGDSAELAWSRLRLPSGTWLVLNGSPLSGLDRSGGDVVVTIEEARPPEIVPLVVAAFELTPESARSPSSFSKASPARRSPPP